MIGTLPHALSRSDGTCVDKQPNLNNHPATVKLCVGPVWVGCTSRLGPDLAIRYLAYAIWRGHGMCAVRQLLEEFSWLITCAPLYLHLDLDCRALCDLKLSFSPSSFVLNSTAVLPFIAHIKLGRRKHPYDKQPHISLFDLFRHTCSPYRGSCCHEPLSHPPRRLCLLFPVWSDRHQFSTDNKCNLDRRRRGGVCHAHTN